MTTAGSQGGWETALCWLSVWTEPGLCLAEAAGLLEARQDRRCVERVESPQLGPASTPEVRCRRFSQCTQAAHAIAWMVSVRVGGEEASREPPTLGRKWVPLLLTRWLPQACSPAPRRPPVFSFSGSVGSAPSNAVPGSRPCYAVTLWTVVTTRGYSCVSPSRIQTCEARQRHHASGILETNNERRAAVPGQRR